MIRLAALAAALLVLLAGAVPAQARWFAAQPVDGPPADVVTLGGADLARDGTGGIVYLRNDGGQRHVFVAQVYGGELGPPQRVDPGLAGDASQPRIAASADGKLVVAFVSGGSLYAAVCPDKRSPFARPVPVDRAAPSDAILNPALDVSTHGVGYLAYAAPGGGGHDVKVARLGISATRWNVMPGSADIDAAHDAGTGRGRAAIAVSADGTAVVAWGEAGGVPLRRVGRKRISSQALGATDASLAGHAPGAGDSPRVALEDSSSFGYVVLRQTFANGDGTSAAHLIGRRLVGGTLDRPRPVGGLGFPAPDGAREPVLAMDGRGRGLAGGIRSATGPAVSSLLRNDEFTIATPLSVAAPFDPDLQVAAGQNETGVAAWFGPAASDPAVLASFTDDDRFEAPAELSGDWFGPVDPDGGLAAAANRRGDAVVAFLQGAPGQRRVVAGVYDEPPGHASVVTPRRVHTPRPRVRWRPAVDLMGPVTYAVILDGQPVATTNGTAYRVHAALAAGNHRIRVDAIDLRGQRRRGKDRRLTVDVSG